MTDQLDREFLEALLRTASPSGDEGDATAVWRQWGEQHSEATETDPLGNVYLHLRPTATPRIVLTAHMDEIALVVKYIDDHGFLFVETMGRWDPDVMAGQRVIIRTKRGAVRGVLGRNDFFRRSDEERTRPARTTDFWIDIGASSRSQAQAAVRIGDPAVIDVKPFFLDNRLLVARGLDDRIGCFVVAETHRALSRVKLSFAVTAMASVQEEVGLRGAQVGGYRADPCAAFAVDLFSTSDTPGSGPTRCRFGEISLGAGPVIARGPNMAPELFELLTATAEREGIPYQVDAEPHGTSTDANVLQLSRSGVRTALVSIPNRYSHTPIEIVNWADVVGSVRLLTAAVAGLVGAEWMHG